uniref:Uncharacterized protein n=1 Tax=Odontella aurita TaxID=265563 RepID=A0A7S4K312_9STRA|mmetsp:Transcript_60317/g.178664  ORF Transcript_60317/g.178664 Transcript_60317/m.178664 type:complete len:333 (+) Transcript_60317:2-1000(+)
MAMATAAVTSPGNETSNEPRLSAVCASCHRTLHRRQFQKKEFQKAEQKRHNGGRDDEGPVCRNCKQTATALRLNQKPPPVVKDCGRIAEGSGVKRRPNNFGYCTYLDRLFGMRCFPAIVALGAFTTAKDATESMAAINAAENHGGVGGRRDKDFQGVSDDDDGGRVLCLCIGDGTTPRTAVLASFVEQGWECASIDPELGEEWTGEHGAVRGLTGYRCTLEDFMKEEEEDRRRSKRYEHLVLLCVHSHARFIGGASIPRIRARYGYPRTTLVSLPCCPGFWHVRDVGRFPDASYEDDCVFSACRTVQVWNFERGDPPILLCGEVTLGQVDPP